LLAPNPIQRGVPAANNPAAVVGGTLGFNKFNKPGEQEDSKFNKVMDWGTPRLVTKNRELVVDAKSLQ
jgi:hypothetical protein